ncbi:ROK family protein [Polymorphospora rubra]|uniref:Kanosamine kinase n=1 Tax=Polymorphospora rubra TaxID=338584 RepID=A0A810NA34_9ACTN|nr:ROK family protein [Polymorphospora rubra]BCJ69264.1 kanosamine kinase [Polymorphospora rubra]
MPGGDPRDGGVLGVDVGGTKVALRAEAPGRPTYDRTFHWPREADLATDLATLAAEVTRLRDGWGPVAAVGVAMPATTDPAGTVTTWPNRPGWTGLDLTGELRRLFPGAATAVADDGDLAALAEARHVGCDDVVYLGVGTGIGGGVVWEGRSVPGRSSAEIGHMVVALDGERCDCGRRGCLQAIASGPATLRRAGIARGVAVSFDDLRAGLRDGLPWAVEAVHATCTALAAAVVSLGELLAPTVVIVGGGFAGGLPGLVPLVGHTARMSARPGRPVPVVTAAALGGLSSLHGALWLAHDLTGGPGLRR